MKTTREYAVELRKAADFLDSRPEFDVECIICFGNDRVTNTTYYNKEKFLAAAKALGAAKKSYTDGEYAKFRLTVEDFPFSIDISRDKVCKKTVVYDCEPLFSSEEIEAF